MSTLPIHMHEVIRFYERVKLRPASSEDRPQIGSPDLLNISAEAKKTLVREQARCEVLEKIRR